MKAFEKNIRKVEPYVPGEQPGRKVIKLNTNENPYPPAPGVQKAMEQISPDKLRMYPDPTASVLVDSLAEYYGVNKDQIFDQRRITDGISNTHSCHRAGFGKGLYHDQILVLIDQFQCRLSCKVNIGFIHDYDHILIVRNDIFYKLKILINSGRCIRIR